VIEADLILHVRDVSHGDTEAQSHDVGEVLRDLGIEPADPRIVEVWNKIDRVDAAERARLENLAVRHKEGTGPVLVSAITGEGTDMLIVAIEAQLAAARLTLEVAIDVADGAGMSWLHRHAEVLSRSADPDGRLHVTIRVDPDQAGRVRAKFGEGNIAGMPVGS
jgi:GTPase